MAADDLAFVAILLGSVVVSALLRLCPVRFRADASAAAGVFFVLGACGPQNAAHLLVALLLALAALHLAPERWRQLLSFTLAFAHLAVLRMVPSPPTGPTNAAMLLLTLRLSAAEATTTAELLRYACCHHGLFTGPHISLGDWHAAMRAPRPAPTARDLASAILAAVGALAFWRAVASLLPYRLLLGSGDGAAPSADVPSPWILKVLPSLLDPSHVGVRFLYFYVSSYQFRWRFYACWCVMVVSGKLLGLAHPSNAHVAACELATSPSQYIGGWNTSVQEWLKLHVYRSLPRSTPRPARILATFAVSAFWHGVHPGYYLFFFGLFVMVCVEQLVRAACAACAPSPAPQTTTKSRAPPAHASSSPSSVWTDRAGWLACHLWTMGCFSFFGGAFNLLEWRDTLALWRGLHFYGVWLVLLPALPAAVALALRRPTPSTSMSTSISTRSSARAVKAAASTTPGTPSIAARAGGRAVSAGRRSPARQPVPGGRRTASPAPAAKIKM